MIKKLILGFVVLFSIEVVAKEHKQTVAIPKSAGIPTGSFKGYDRIKDLINTQVLKTFELDLASLLINSGNTESISVLLGKFQGVGNNNGFVNGKPNAVNMFLWRKILKKLAGEIALFCPNRNDETSEILYSLNDRFHTDLTNLCTSRSKNHMKTIWTHLVGFEADEEFEGFYTTVLNASLLNSTTLSDKEFVAGILYAIFMNPHFLLEN